MLHSLLAAKLASTSYSPFLARYSQGGLLGVYGSASSGESAALLESAVAALKSIASGSSSIDVVKNQVRLLSVCGGVWL